MPVVLERFVLGVLSTLFVVNLTTNPMQMNPLQRLGIGMTVAGLAVFFGATAHRMNQSPAPPLTDAAGPARPVPAEEKKVDQTPTAPQPEEAKGAKEMSVPPDRQSKKPKPNSRIAQKTQGGAATATSGDQSPIIKGDGNTVTYGAPDMKPMTEGLSVSPPRQVPSDREDLPYAIELAIQSRGDVSPFAFTVRTNKPLYRGTFRIVNHAMMIGSYDNDYAGGPHPSYKFGTSSPALTAKTPLIVVLYAKEPFTVIAVERVPYENFMQ